MGTRTEPPTCLHLSDGWADVVRGRATLLRGLELEPGGTVERTLDMEPGLTVPTTALRLADGRAATVTVQDAEGMRLPVYGHTRDRSVRIRTERDLLARAGERRVLMLGPYPVSAIDVIVETWEGVVRKAEHAR